MTDPTDIDDLTIDGADLMAQILASLEPDAPADGEPQTITTHRGHPGRQRWSPAPIDAAPIVSRPKRAGLSPVQLAVIGIVFALGIVLGVLIGMGR